MRCWWWCLFCCWWWWWLYWCSWWCFFVGHLWVACIVDHPYKLSLPKILQWKFLSVIILVSSSSAFSSKSACFIFRTHSTIKTIPNPKCLKDNVCNKCDFECLCYGHQVNVDIKEESQFHSSSVLNFISHKNFSQTWRACRTQRAPTSSTSKSMSVSRMTGTAAIEAEVKHRRRSKTLILACLSGINQLTNRDVV